MMHQVQILKIILFQTFKKLIVFGHAIGDSCLFCKSSGQDGDELHLLGLVVDQLSFIRLSLIEMSLLQFSRNILKLSSNY